MFLCLRIDLDYVPWDNPDAAEYGHGEPAMLLRLLDLARQRGYRYHFFTSNRALRAFPANAEAVLNDGHDLDWLCKHPENPENRFQEALSLFSMHGHVPKGLSIRGVWPADAPGFEGLESLTFLSSLPGLHPDHLKHFPVETRGLREGLRGGLTARAWCDSTKATIRDVATRNRPVTVVVRPQVLAKHDPRLTFLREVLDLAPAIGLRMSTLRQELSKP